MGGASVDLPECHAEMDVDAHALYVAYQDYWSKLMRQSLAYTPTQLRAEKIEDPYLLIMELYLRLAMQALRSDSPLRSDQERRIFIEILSKFTVKLSEQSVIEGALQLSLFAEHTKWLSMLVKAAGQLDEMHKNKPVLNENLAYLESLKQKIKRHLIVLLAKKGNFGSSDWESSLKDKELNVTLEQVEDKVLNSIKKSVEKQTVTQITSVVAQGISNSKEGQQAISCIEVNLIERQILGEADAERQRLIISNTQDIPEIEQGYAALNKTEIFYQFVAQVQSLVTTAGWLAMLFGVVDLARIDKVISDHVNLCTSLFSQLGFNTKKDFINTPLGKEFCLRTQDDFTSRKKLPELSMLQDPELLKTVFFQLNMSFERLEKLGPLLGCEVICNPFLKKGAKRITTGQVKSLILPENVVLQGGNRSSLSTAPISSSLGKSFPRLSKTTSTSTTITAKTTATTTAKSVTVPPSPRSTPTTSATAPPSPTATPSNPFDEYDDVSARSPSLSASVRDRLKEKGLTASTRRGDKPQTQQGQSKVKKSTDVIILSKDLTQKKEKIQTEGKQNETQSFEMHSIPAAKEKKQRTRTSMFTTTITYIQTFLANIGGLSDEEIDKAKKDFDTLVYFTYPQVSEFCKKVREIIVKFSPAVTSKQPSNLAGIGDLWMQRKSEMTLLKYLCIYAAQSGNDSYLINFINAMIGVNTTVFWSDLNTLPRDLENLLVLQRNGQIKASFVLEMEPKLISTIQNMQEKNAQLHGKCQKLEAELEAAQNENNQLKSENAKLKQPERDIKELQRQMGALQQQNSQNTTEIAALKASASYGQKRVPIGTFLQQDIPIPINDTSKNSKGGTIREHIDSCTLF